jgi:hypothetical protein
LHATDIMCACAPRRCGRCNFEQELRSSGEFVELEVRHTAATLEGDHLIFSGHIVGQNERAEQILSGRCVRGLAP